MNLLEAQKTFRDWLEAKHYRDGTVTSYSGVVASYGRYLCSHPSSLNLSRSKRVESYLSWRVLECDVSPSTQNVELNALITFYRMLGFELDSINALRARQRDRIPPILSKEQVRTLIERFPPDFRVIPMILYGCGMRINECLRLRIKDVNFSIEKFSIHQAKGDKERIVPIPSAIVSLVKIQHDKAVSMWKIDKHHNFNGVNCGGIEKKYSAYPYSLDWYWLFPDANYSEHPKTRTPMMRHHIMDFTVQRMFKEVRKRSLLPVYTTPHVLRHACLTHMAADMISKGFTETMIRAELKKLSGHVKDETLEGYIHLALPKNAFVVSPIEGLV